MDLVFQLHAILRWVVLAAAIIATGKALIGWLGKQPFTKLDNLLGMIFTIVLDVQFLLGLLLWIAGPINLSMLGSGGMSNAGTRFLLLEHPLMILLALVLAHIGRVRSRRIHNDAAQHRTALLFYGLSFLLVALVFLMR